MFHGLIQLLYKQTDSADKVMLMGIDFGKTYVVSVGLANTNFSGKPQQAAAFQGIKNQINAVNVTTQNLPSRVVARSGKLYGDMVAQMCQVKNLAVQPSTDDLPEKSLSFQGRLKIQENMLKAACRSLRLWGVQDQRYFKTVFGQVDANQRINIRDKKEEIYQQLSKMLELNQRTVRRIPSHAAIPMDFSLPYPSKPMKDFCALVYLTPFEKSLKAQKKTLEAAKDQLKRWDVEDQKRFRSIFGHSVISKRANIYSQIDKMLEQNKNYLKALTTPSADIDTMVAELKVPRFATSKLEKYCSLAYQHAIGRG